MFEYILKNKHATYAYDNKTGINTFENTKNIDNIIETYNNIETIENLYNITLEEYKTKKFKLIIDTNCYKNMLIGILFILFGTIINNLIITNLLLISCGCGLNLIACKNLISNTIKISKLDKEYLKKLDILTKEHDTENKTLELLKENDVKINIESEQPKVELSRSEKIKTLYKKLHLIDFVQKNLKDLKIVQKKGLLINVLSFSLTKEEIEFVKEILNNDNNNNYKKQKIKQLTK